MDVESNKPLRLTVDGVDVLLLRDHDGKLYACENRCSHADKPLHRGHWQPESAHLTCPFHHAVFSLAENGAIKEGPTTLPLTMLPVDLRVEPPGGEVVYVGLDDAD